MAEYYAVLKKAVAGLHPNAHDARRAVYDKARAALVGQLKAINPPLSTSEISRQRLELEEAIRRVERETSQGYAASPEPLRSAQPAREAPAPTPALQPYDEEPEPQISEEAFAEDVFNQALEEIERQSAASQPAPASPGPAQPRPRPPPAPAARPQPAAAPFERPRPQPPQQPVYQPPADEYDEYEAEQEQQYDEHYDDGPAPAPGYVAAPSVDAIPDLGRDRQMQRWAEPGRPPARARIGDDPMDRPARRSRLPMILISLLVIAIIGGAAAFGWSERERIENFVASFELPDLGGSGESETGSDPAGATKDDDRLLDTAATPAEPAPATTALPDSSTGQSASLETGEATAGGAPADATGEVAVAQRAVFYEEQPAEPNTQPEVETLQATVVWRYAESEANGPTVQASIDVPERSLKLRMMIRKNVDVNLPASHLVEVFIDVPSDFPGGGIAAVPTIVMKQSEDAQGEPVAAATAKVADGYFWIALDAEGDSVTRNVALLRERTWIDMPLAYENGQRAILSFEMGEPGRAAIERALAAWGG